jgi:hypothetical protein
MRPGDRPEFLRVLNGLAVIKGKELTSEALDLWWKSMSAWTIEDFKSAASHLVGACQFMPTPYDFVQLRKAGDLTAGEAWQKVLSGAQIEPDSRMARAAKICGGQQAIRHANVERELPFIQRRFMEVYSELSEVDTVRDALPNLTDPSRGLEGPKELRALLKGVL